MVEGKTRANPLFLPKNPLSLPKNPLSLWERVRVRADLGHT
jgi:hypothetical protein